ncbi:MAG TPA: hypothetical protein VJL27_01015 [Patescibacteria group bacterium]|nr:hypothetical protein [Patescibacteria group bacterium]
MKPIKILLFVFIALIVIVGIVLIVFKLIDANTTTNEPSSATEATTDKEYFNAVKKQVKAAGIDVYWTDSACVFVRTYDEDGGKALEIREKHDGAGCPGDPQFSPRVAAFRISKSNKVEWFEPITGQYTTLAEYKSSLDALPPP